MGDFSLKLSDHIPTFQTVTTIPKTKGFSSFKQRSLFSKHFKSAEEKFSVYKSPLFNKFRKT
jgi:hypothetical protein